MKNWVCRFVEDGEGTLYGPEGGRYLGDIERGCPPWPYVRGQHERRLEAVCRTSLKSNMATLPPSNMGEDVGGCRQWDTVLLSADGETNCNEFNPPTPPHHQETCSIHIYRADRTKNQARNLMALTTLHQNNSSHAPLQDPNSNVSPTVKSSQLFHDCGSPRTDFWIVYPWHWTILSFHQQIFWEETPMTISQLVGDPSVRH